MLRGTFNDLDLVEGTETECNAGSSAKFVNGDRMGKATCLFRGQ